MLSKLRHILNTAFSDEGGVSAGDDKAHAMNAMAGLLCEVANADHQIDERETHSKISLLSKLLDVSESQAETMIATADERSKSSVSLYEYTDKLRELSQEQRYELILAMWEVAYADGNVDPLEESVIRKAAELLYVDHQDFIRAKLAVQKS